MIQTEKTIFEKDKVKITNLRVIFEKGTCLIADITSVEIKKVGPKPTGGIALLMLILLALCLSLANSDLIGNYMRFGVLLLSGGLVVLAIMMTKESFIVWIITEKEVMQVFSSRNEASIKEIVKALNAAIDQK